MRRNNRFDVKRTALCGLLTAMMLVLGFIESMIPVAAGVPGIKLGLANIVTLVALYLFKTKYAYMILIPRCVLGAVFGGGITGLLFSLCGGVLALAIMAFAKKLPLFSIYGVSILGAAAHNIGQILASMALMNSVYIGAYLPYLLIVAVFTGLITGGACAGVLRVLPKAIVSVDSEMSR